MYRKDDLVVSLSGIRGIWQKGLSQETTLKLCLAASEIYRKSKQKTILIGRDTRISGQKIFSLAKTAFKSQGFKISDLGIIPTPTLQINTRQQHVAGALMITASHNPPEYNGLKFLDPRGRIFDHQKIEKIIRFFKEKKPLPKLNLTTHRCLSGPLKKAYQYHFDQIFRWINLSLIKNKRFRVAVDSANGAGAFLDKIFLEKMNCTVFEVNCQKDGHFRRGIEPTADNLSLLKQTVVLKKADIGFAQDADADRLILINEKGESLSDEGTLAIAVLHLLSQRRFKNKKVVINLATSKLIDDLVEKHQGQLIKSAVGEINLVKTMAREKALFGGEGNIGGLIFSKLSPGRDSFLAMALILEHLAKTGKKLSQIAGAFPVYYRQQEKIATLSRKELAQLWQKLLKYHWSKKKIWSSSLDGLKLEFKDSWLLIRPSKTEPIIRIIAEADTSKQVEKLISAAKKQASPFFRKKELSPALTRRSKSIPPHFNPKRP
ncbi:MAG: hypothetical protein JW991_02400 [Candidatus Pacebacteria bacterium]|nr:hypothetical protein [Candidatus Paceibacterota bacterium]